MKRTLTFSAFAFVVALVAGCSNPADNVPAAKVSSATNAPAEAVETPKATESSAAAVQSYVVNPENSAINFIGSKVTGSHNGGFKKFTGELHVANGKLVEAGNKIVIDMTSIYADNDRLTGHLKSKDFFNVAQIPTATLDRKSVV